MRQPENTAGQIPASSLHPLDLDVGKVAAWQLTSGFIDVFAIPGRPGRPTGMKIHLFRLNPGDLLFPMPSCSGEEGGLRFTACGTSETFVCPLTLEELHALAADSPDQVFPAVDRWAVCLLRKILAVTFHKQASVARLGPERDEFQLKTGSQITAATELLWLTTLSGRLVYPGRGRLDTGGLSAPLPLPRGGRMHVMEDGTRVEALTSGAYFKRHGTLPDFVLLGHIFNQVVLELNQAEAAAGLKLGAARDEEDGRLIDGALRDFATILEKDGEENKWQWRTVMKREYLFWAVMIGLTGLCFFWFGELIHQTTRDWQLRRQAAVYRADGLRNKAGKIRIGVAAARDSEHDKTLWNGIELAAGEINRAGGAAGRPLELVERNDHGRLDQARKIAQDFADDMSMSVVIGHRFSPISLATAMIYEYYGLLMICPRAVTPKLTRNGYRRVFRTHLSGTTIGDQMAEFAKGKGYERIVILYLDDAFGKGIANGIERRADDLGLAVVDRVPHSRSITQKEMRNIMSIWRENRKFDAIMMVTIMAYGPDFIRIARENGIAEPMILSESLDSDDIVEKVGGPAGYCDDIYLASVYHPDAPYPRARAFAEAYEQKYHHTPNGMAAQGYDAVNIIAEAVRRSGSIVPDDLADELRKMKGWMGVTGPHTFTEEGDMIKPVQFKVIKNGRLELYPLKEDEAEAVD